MPRYNKLFIIIQIVCFVNILPMMNKYDLIKNKQVGNVILIIFYVISYSFSLSLRQTIS